MNEEGEKGTGNAYKLTMQHASLASGQFVSNRTGLNGGRVYCRYYSGPLANIEVDTHLATIPMRAALGTALGASKHWEQIKLYSVKTRKRHS